ncbi:hypothetical protein ACLB2K_026174 [Fragaria x ananassa]
MSREVEFLSPSLAPTQVAMRQKSGLGCPVFDSLMLKLALRCYLQSMGVWKEYVDLLLRGVCACFISQWLVGAVLLGMISGDRVIAPYSRLGQVFWLCTNKSSSPQIPSSREGGELFPRCREYVFAWELEAWCRVPKSPREGSEVTEEGSENPSCHLAMLHVCHKWPVYEGHMFALVGERVRAGGITVRTGGVTVRASGVTVRASGVTVRASGVTVRTGGLTVRTSGWKGLRWWRNCLRWWRDSLR